eukprot:444828_1
MTLTLMCSYTKYKTLVTLLFRNLILTSFNFNLCFPYINIQQPFSIILSELWLHHRTHLIQNHPASSMQTKHNNSRVLSVWKLRCDLQQLQDAEFHYIVFAKAVWMNYTLQITQNA